MSLLDRNPSGLVKYCHFDSSIIIVCVRWYRTYKLSYRDLVAIMAERNVEALQEESLLATVLMVRANKYLNNLIEQDHRRVKQRVKPVLT